MQTSGCLKALRELESTGHFDLPKAQHKAGTKSPRRLTEPVPLPVDVPSEVTYISALELVRGQNAEQMRIWKNPYPGCSCGALTHFFPQNNGLPGVLSRSALS